MRRDAFPLCNDTESLWKKNFISSELFFPQRLALCRAMSFKTFRASGSHPPNVSTTRGWKAMPWARQGSKWWRTFVAFRISIAAAGKSAARSTMASSGKKVKRTKWIKRQCPIDSAIKTSVRQQGQPVNNHEGFRPTWLRSSTMLFFQQWYILGNKKITLKDLV